MYLLMKDPKSHFDNFTLFFTCIFTTIFILTLSVNFKFWILHISCLFSGLKIGEIFKFSNLDLILVF